MIKKVYIVSDGTGQSALNIMRAALLQFDDPGVRFTVYSRVEDVDKLETVLDHARAEEAFVAFTMVRKKLRARVHEYCHDHNMIHFDIIGPPIDKLTEFVGKEAKEEPGALRQVDEKYFKRIEAIEYSLQHDDGKVTTNLDKADMVILGLSRTSKTPTSFFLAQQGFKVVNIPLVPEIPIPKAVFDIDQNKVVLLMMDPEVLQKVRSARLKHYRTTSTYNDIKKIFEEVEFCYELVRKNRRWHLVDTTNKSIEETSREIIYHVVGRDMEI